MHANGARVIFTGRSTSKAVQIFNEVKVSYTSTASELISTDKSLVFRCVDQSDLDDVNLLIKYINNWIDIEGLEKIDYLFNNAGVFSTEFSTTKQGFETNMGINFISHMIITEALLPIIKKSTDPRVIMTSSMVHKMSEISDLNLSADKKNSHLKNYSMSKLAQIVYTKLMS